jgi:RalA-binding protein 1
MSSHPSPTPTQRSASALPQLPASSSTSSQPLAADALLRAHSAAQDPKLAALEQAISERNSLSAQNSQLWKLIEKQRAGYNQLIKELERIRAERDAYKVKLGINNNPSKRDKKHKLSITQQSDDHRTLFPLYHM